MHRFPTRLTLLLAVVTVVASAARPAAAAEPTPVPLTSPSPSAPPTPAPTPSADATAASASSAPAAPVPAPATPAPTAVREPGSVILADGTVLPPMPEAQGPSVHAAMLDEHVADPNTFAPGGAPTFGRDDDGRLTTTAEAVGADVVTSEGGIGAITGRPGGLQREVLGFLPYWMLDDATLAELNYQLTSTIAYFSVGALPTGNLDKGTSTSPSTGWAGWMSSEMTSVIDRAHAAGGKVVLTVTMMAWNESGYDRMRTLLTSATNRGRLVGQIVDAVRSRGADGVNLDFELVPTDLRAQYTAFVRQVKAALVNAGVGSYLTVCTTGGAASWATGYDVPGLVAAGAADAIFVMGYDFHWSGSARAGGVAPIDSPYVLDVSSALADFLEQAPASKLIWGVPYYGRGWSTTSNQLNGVTTGGSFSYYYTGHLRDAGRYGRLWDSVGKVPWYRYWDSAKGSWVQVYYDDAASLGVKYDLVNRYGLAGTGMWTLLMDGGRDELWRLLADRFVNDTTPPQGGIRVLPQRTTSMAIEVAWNAIDYQSGVDSYTVQVRDRASSTWTTWLSGTRATRATYLGVPGRTYEFRVRATDWKGNAQAWTTAPGMASEVRPGSFARVTTSSLNVRSGAGTTYAVVDTLAAGDRAYVMSGPISAGGTTWFQVQYGFAEWPSAEYARIGWVALGSADSTYLVPSYAPSVTRLDPFLEAYARSVPAFSPNGDGRRDVVSVSYRLPTSVTSMRVDVVDAADTLVRRLDLGAQPAGANQVSWNGRTTAGTAAPEGRYVVKIVVTDASGATHAAPAPSAPPNVVARWGVTLDVTAPTITSLAPANGAAMVPAAVRPSIGFAEPMTGLTPATVRVQTPTGVVVDASLVWNAAARTVTVRPDGPLAADAGYRLVIEDAVTDVAGNPVGARVTAFTTAPGTAIVPARRFTVAPGTHTAYRIGAGGDLLATKTVTFGTTSGASTSHRATMPNLPGRWLHVDNGTWAGLWIPEGPGSFLPGETERTVVPTTTRIAFASGTHVGYRFDASGSVLSSRTVTLARASGANVSTRAIINGRPHWWVVNGALGGTWVRESSRAYRAGWVEERSFGSPPRIALAAGTYTAWEIDGSGRRVRSVTATLSRPSGAPVDGSAVVNGRAYLRVAAGIWAGLWLPVEPRIALAP